MRKLRVTFLGVLISSIVFLVIIGGVVLKGGSFFSRDRTYVMYFDASASGLREGAPVELKGVKVGEVTRVDLHYDPSTDAISEASLAYQLSRTLAKISDAADSMRALSDYPSRRPDAMLRGKQASGEG